MVSIRSLLSSAFIAAQYSLLVQAEDLHDSPYVPLTGDGVIPLKDNAMIRGKRIQYVATNEDGGKVMMQGNKVGLTLDEEYNDNEISDFKFFEEQFGTFIKNAGEIANKYPRGQLPSTPWPGSYWPMTDDGINYRWGNGPSASEKYATAVGLDVKKFMDNISSISGVDAKTDDKACRKHRHCDSGSRCGIRVGQSVGYCIPNWEGMCDGWAPASILEKEPKCPVRIGVVTFQPKDIKALMTQVYHSSSIGTVFAGISYTGNDDGVDDDYLDRFDRYNDPKHRDMSPAVFHILCANLIGRYQKPFIIDRDAGVEIWNHPVYSYDFDEITPMEPDEASMDFFGWPSYAQINERAKSVHYVKTVLTYVNEGFEDGYLSGSDGYLAKVTYEYLLELDDKDNIIGGEWVNKSRYEKHPDFAWAVWNSPAKGFVTEDSNISYDFVKMLIFLSNADDC